MSNWLRVDQLYNQYHLYFIIVSTQLCTYTILYTCVFVIDILVHILLLTFSCGVELLGQLFLEDTHT